MRRWRCASSSESLRRLRTDYLDLWQIHECVYDNDPERHFARGGVVEALDRAKQQGKVRYVGFTGHKDPDILLQMLSFDYPFDACQLPLNGFDAHFRSFQKRVLPELARRQIAAIGMKSLGGDGRVIEKKRARVDRRAALCDEPAGVHNRVGHRFDESAAPESADRARVFTDERAGTTGIRAPPRRAARSMDGSSCTRRRPSMMERKDDRSTDFRRRRSLAG